MPTGAQVTSQRGIKIIIVALFLCRPAQWPNVRRGGIADCGKYTAICNNVFFPTVYTDSTVVTLCGKYTLICNNVFFCSQAILLCTV